MELTSDALEFFNGVRFSNGWKFRVPPQRRIIQRNKRLIELANGKSVIHLGCADHLELIEKKIKKGIYLHSQLEGVASKLVGVDISEEGLQAMHKLGIKDIFLPSDLPKQHYDILLVSDVIEHVPDVKSFLASLHMYDFETLIITTPNAFRLYNRFSYRFEHINTDHYLWFSPFTLCKVLIQSGFEVKSLEFTSNASKFNFLKILLLKRYPLLQDGLLIIATKKA